MVQVTPDKSTVMDAMVIFKLMKLHYINEAEELKSCNGSKDNPGCYLA